MIASVTFIIRRSSLIVFLIVYVGLGLSSEIQFSATHPLPTTLLADFNLILRAFSDASQGRDPYVPRAIGSGFLLPPPALLLAAPFAPLTFLPSRAALLIVLNLAALALLLCGIARRSGYPLSRVWWWFPLAFGFAPVLESLHLGQLSLLAEFGIFLLVAFEVASPPLAGFGLAMASLTRVTPLAFFAYLLVTRHRRTALAASLAIFLGLVLSGLGFGVRPLLTYWDILGSLPGAFLQGNGTTQGLLSVIDDHGWLAPASPQAVQRLVYLYFALTALVSLALGFLRRQTTAVFLLMALLAAVGPSFLWYQEWVYLLVPIFIAMAQTRLHPAVVVWSVGGLCLIQIDQFGATRGLLAHVWSQLSILLVLAWQINDARALIPVARGKIAPWLNRKMSQAASALSRPIAASDRSTVTEGIGIATPELDLRPGLPVLIAGLFLGIAVRLWVILHGVEVADVQHLHDIGRYFLAGNDPYRLPPFQSNFPPIALLLESSAEVVSRQVHVPFHIIFKLWPLAADVGTGLAIFAVLFRAGQSSRRAALWSAIFMLNPVSILITAAHGNLDPVTNFLSVLALALMVWNPRRFFAWSALALGCAIGIKPNPVFLLPILAGYRGLAIRERVFFVVICALPAGLTFIPFFLDTPSGVIGNVFGYTGEVDFGYAAVLRIAWYFKTASLNLPGSVPLDLGRTTRLTFGLAYLALMAYGVGRLNPARLVTLSYLLFYVLFTGLSAQYAVWVVPFAILASDWFVLAYTGAAVFGLVGFYTFFFPSILFGDFTWFKDQLPGNAPLYAGGIATMWGISTIWLIYSIGRLFTGQPWVSSRDRLPPVASDSRLTTGLDRARPALAILALAGCAWTLVTVIQSIGFVLAALRG